MKTEHAIDWRKTAAEIEADYSAVCMERDEQAERISALEAHNAVLLAFVKNVSEQTPEKPDYWSSCCQCSSNASKAEDLVASTPEQSLSSIRRAERERCAQMAESYAYMSENFNALAEKIRQMED